MLSPRIRLYSTVFTILTLGLLSTPLQAQDMQSSPTTRYGYGLPAHATPTIWRGMGGVGIALSSPKAINFTNPAAFASTDSLSFLMDVATSVHFGQYRDATVSKPSLQGGLDYLAVQFPIYGDRVALSLGLIPSFYTGYGMVSTQGVEGDSEEVKYVQNFTGRGSFQTAYLGIGAEVVSNLYIGVSAKYLFGSETHSWTLVPNFSQLTQSMETHRLRISSLQAEAGLQYRLLLPSRSKDPSTATRDQIVLGATYSPGLPLDPEATLIVNRNVNSQTRPDIENKNLVLETSTPHTIGVGLAWVRPTKYAVSADLKTSLWSRVPNIFAGDGLQLRDSYYAAAGFQILPDPYSSNYGRMITYSGGVNFSTSYYEMAPIGQMKYIGASVGVGLPILLYGLERNSALNLSLEYKHGLADKASGFSSDMLRLTLGFAFNETWFRKLKIY